ncbi:uncharacterized protein G2W53_038420 [Senna tora]|uniref:Uncharacterized protein n=1 Tax=Senna tora TaxID=362788 RepID=A0A834SLP8_9FABA|nr:uncharacterized protein G2W53_038420 [Senna tora]
MDLWVVVAAAGAGYLAKYWNNLSKSSDSSNQWSSEDHTFENTKSSSHPLCREAWGDESGKDVSSEQRVSDGNLVDGLPTVEVMSNKVLHCRNIRHGNYDESIVLSISNLPLSFSPNENLCDVEDGNEQISNVSGNYGFLCSDSSAGQMGPNHHLAGSKTSRRNKHLYGHLSRPLSSLESCLMAQLYKEHCEMEEYVFSSVPSPSTPTRSFLVSNGSQIISRSNPKSFSASIVKEAYQENNESVFGIPSLPKIRSFNDPKKLKHEAGQWRSGKHICNQLDAMFLFSLGISFGIITSIVTNKREVDKLRDLLKQTENLVQDLQEELEMKDSMTVKELNNENYGSQDTCDHSFYDKEINGFSPEKHMDNSPRNGCKEIYNQKEEECSESMSKIEAELEAELERLGLNINTSNLDRKLSELAEVDPDFVADFAQGELRADTVRGKPLAQPKSDDDTSETTTPLPADYAVSPHELTLRLHEVIESRLEERVKELEIALQNSQRKVQLMESEHKHCYKRNFHSYGHASLFSRGNPLTYDDCDPMAEPLVMNLSGEALDAYNEAYEELMKTDESEENSPSGIHDNDHEEGLLQVQHSGANGSIAYLTNNGGRMSGELSSSKVTTPFEGQNCDVCEFNAVTEDENSASDHDMEREMIRRIVDRTKKGSPIFQNVQRMLYSMGEDEH